MTEVRRAVWFSMLEGYSLIVLSLTSNVVLARLLSPSEIGAYSVCMAVIGIAAMLREFGISGYLIQKPELSRADIATAMGFAITIGTLLFVVVFLLAEPMARFYGDARLVSVTHVVSINFLTLPLGIVSMALLRRELRFKALLWANVIATATGLAVTVSGALLGWGALSMAAGSVIGNIVLGACAWWLRRADGWVWPSFRSWREVLSYGGQTTVTNTVWAIAGHANDLIVGRLLNLGAVAMISRAQGLMNMYHRDLMGSVRNVALPGFASSLRSGVDVAAAEMRAVSIITVIGWSFYAFVSVFALDITRLMFGPQWDAAAPLVPLFCLAGAIADLNSLTPQRLIACGHLAVVTRLELIIQPLRIVSILVVLLIWPSMLAVASMAVGNAVVGVLIYRHAVHRLAPVSGGLYLQMVARSGAVALTFAAPAVALHLLDGLTTGPQGLAALAGCALAGAVLAVPMGLLVRHPLLDEPWLQPLLRRLSFPGTAH